MDVDEIMVHRQVDGHAGRHQPPPNWCARPWPPHTRLPLYRGEPENIIGVLHARTCLRAIATIEGGVDALDVASLAREPWFIPTHKLKDQLAAFRRRREHFALVVDEYGALQGLVSWRTSSRRSSARSRTSMTWSPRRAPPAGRLGQCRWRGVHPRAEPGLDWTSRR